MAWNHLRNSPLARRWISTSKDNGCNFLVTGTFILISRVQDTCRVHFRLEKDSTIYRDIRAKSFVGLFVSPFFVCPWQMGLRDYALQSVQRCAIYARTLCGNVQRGSLESRRRNTRRYNPVDCCATRDQTFNIFWEIFDIRNSIRYCYFLIWTKRRGKKTLATRVCLASALTGSFLDNRVPEVWRGFSLNGNPLSGRSLSFSCTPLPRNRLMNGWEPFCRPATLLLEIQKEVWIIPRELRHFVVPFNSNG